MVARKSAQHQKNHSEVSIETFVLIGDWPVIFLRFFLFIFRLVRFWILHSNWVGFINCLCFIMVCLYEKVILV